MVLTNLESRSNLLVPILCKDQFWGERHHAYLKKIGTHMLVYKLVHAKNKESI